ncbi:Ig-like domain-containing protein [Roseovarius sp. 2305UL8-3]|uniref:Ig-like domain-containing protein n=1 Tax=Roseovarius conchicola TaxID=3121636 RepID=UPI003528027C
MKAIDFVVRTSAGSSQVSSVPADKNVHVIDAGVNQEISLNLRQSDIRSYNREGSNLEIVLADGRVIILDGFFGADGVAESRLFISADGYLNEVTLVEASDGAVYAQYGPTEQWGKWSPAEDLIFLDGTDVAVANGAEEDVSMLGAGILGGSGLLGALGVGAAGVGVATVLDDDEDGDGGGTPNTPIEPTINEPGPIVIGGDDVDPTTETLTITGTAEPDSVVVVTIGDETVETTSDEDGNWETSFTGETFPTDGEYTVTAVVTEPDGTETNLTGPEIIIDTVGPDTSVTEGTVSVDEIINAEEYDAGIQVSGTGEVGASVVVTIEGVSHETTVGDNGTWSVTYAGGELPIGEYTTGVTVVSTDSYGNTTTVTDQMQIDTIPHDLAINTSTIETDGVINFVENSDGFAITGTSEPGATVTVEIQGVSQQVVVGQDGTWTAQFAAGTLPGGEYDATITATTVDAAGNPSSTTGTVQVDTQVQNFTMQGETGGADGVINAAEAQGGFSVSGTTEPGSTVVLEMNGQTVNAVVGADGSWTANFTGAQIQQGTYTATMTATTTDPAGNVETLSQSVSVDTDAGSLTLNAGAIGGDGTINEAEAAAGVAVTGTADPNAIVIVTLDGVSHTTQANGAGFWTTTYTNAEITPGTHTPAVTAMTTDAAGNSIDVSGTVNVDTEVLNLATNPYDVATATDGSDVINNDVAGAGFQITGTVEQGSTVSVTLDGVTHQASVDANGNWTADFAAGEISGGERTGNLVVNVTDPAGNTETLTDTIEIDTFINELSLDGPIEGDNVINAAEAADGVQVAGQVEAGSSVTVAVFGKTYNATVDGAGNWSVDIPAGDIPVGESTDEMIIHATDAAGNSTALNAGSLSEQLTVDLVAPDSPDVVGAFRESTGGYRNVTTDSTDDAVSIHQVDGSGNATELDVHAMNNAFLGETNYFFLDASGNAEPIPDGSELVVTHTDDAGNASSTYVVLDETATTAVDVGSISLTGFNIDEIDLRLGDQRELTITEQQLRDLSENGDQLLVRGGSDDTVTITGASASGTTSIEGEVFNVYTLGDGATVVVDDEINVVV